MEVKGKYQVNSILQDVVPKQVAYSGNPAANEIFAELVVAFLEQKMR